MTLLLKGCFQFEGNKTIHNICQTPNALFHSFDIKTHVISFDNVDMNTVKDLKKKNVKTKRFSFGPKQPPYALPLREYLAPH
jgi:hypothetical protein